MFGWSFPYRSQRMPVLAKNVVATSQPLAAQAGLAMLQRGGNAVDAGLAAAIALTVVEPTSNGIGSDAYAILWDGQRLFARDLAATTTREGRALSRYCIQNALDIATHIAASAGRDVPDYGSAIDRLAELKILSGRFASEFRAIAGFRNVVVQGYLDVDVTIVHQLLNQRLDDFVEFARLVKAYLDRAAAESGTRSESR